MNNIVFVNFECNESTKVVAQKIWQWNYGQILRIQGLNLPAAVEIHFSLQKTGGIAERRIGVTRDGVTDVVIPDFILKGEGIERNYSAYAFIYLSDEESGQTEHRIELNITSRPEPEGSTSSDDTTSFGAIMDAVNKIAEQNGQGVSDEKIAEAVNTYMEENPVEGANVTAEKISEVLGYTPAKETDVSQLSATVNDHESRIKAVENNTSVSGNGATTAQANSLWNVLKKTAFVEPLTDEEITALKTAWGITDSGEVEPDEPEEPDVPEVTLTSISATYTGGDVVVGTSVNSLTGITVKATYSDGSTATVTGYTLSGTIAEGSNTITVSYGGKTTTFTVTGIAESSGDSVDTSPQIAEYDKGFYWGSQMETSSYTGACVTIPYAFEHDIEKFKTNANYDAENDYMTGITMFPKIAYYVPNTRFLENGNSVVSTKTKIALYRDDTIVNIVTQTIGQEKQTEVGVKNKTDGLYCNGIAFTLFTDDVEDSYAYWTIGNSQIAPKGVKNGDIVFAGKNTQYYGMKNIDGTMA